MIGPPSAGKILISACLLGQPVRYDGQANAVTHPLIQQWQDEGRLLPLCPEVSGGLPVPRPAAEISGCNATDVIDGLGQVRTADEDDVTHYFVSGAEQALLLCRQHDIRLAILKENSPSCGSTQVYDGSFNGKLTTGMGVTTALLRQNGIRVFSEHEIEKAVEFLNATL